VTAHVISAKREGNKTGCALIDKVACASHALWMAAKVFFTEGKTTRAALALTD